MPGGLPVEKHLSHAEGMLELGQDANVGYYAASGRIVIWAVLPCSRGQGVKVEPITEAAAKEAAQLLKGAGLHGHKYAIDATVAEAALRQPGPVAILTSDVDDMTRLCGSKVRMIGL